MELFIAIEHKGTPFEIPDCSRDDLPEFFKKLGFKVGVEIGVYKAEFTEKFAQAGLKIHGIDPWMAYGDYSFSHVRKGSFQERQDFLYGHSQRVLAPYSNATLVRKTSMDAIGDFEDGSLDFVYIDGHHGFKYVAEDLWEWTKKVREGGIISGHDWGLNTKPPRDPYCLHVKYVVQAFASCFKIKNWWVLGRRETLEGEKRDEWRSWMWFNE